MPRRQLHLAGHAERLQAALDAIDAELEVPAEFPAEVRTEAAQVAVSASTSGRDLTDVPFVTIDPPSSMDLDQAVPSSSAPWTLRRRHTRPFSTRLQRFSGALAMTLSTAEFRRHPDTPQ